MANLSSNIYFLFISRGVTVQQLYSITPSKKSAVRPTDEL